MTRRRQLVEMLTAEENRRKNLASDIRGLFVTVATVAPIGRSGLDRLMDEVCNP